MMSPTKKKTPKLSNLQKLALQDFLYL